MNTRTGPYATREGLATAERTHSIKKRSAGTAYLRDSLRSSVWARESSAAISRTMRIGTSTKLAARGSTPPPR